MREPAVYIMASGRNGTLYTGMTSKLARRVFEHREARVPGFTRRYGCERLVWYERYELMVDATAREKQLKGGSREEAGADRRDEPAMAGPLRRTRLTPSSRATGLLSVGRYH